MSFGRFRRGWVPNVAALHAPAVPTGPTAEIWIGAQGDSTAAGLWVDEPGPPIVYRTREAGVDENWPNVYQIKADGSISSDTSPLDSLGGDNALDRFSWLEYFGKTRQERTGRKIYLVQCAVGGSSVGDESGGAGDHDEWEIGGSLHEATITRANAAIQTILAAEPGAVLKGLAGEIGSNDAIAGSDWRDSGYYRQLTAAVADMQSRIYMDGVSGTTLAHACAAGDAVQVFMSPTDSRLQSQIYLSVDWALRDIFYETPGGRYCRPPTGVGNDLHHTRASIRLSGPIAAAVVDDTTASDFTIIDYSVRAGSPYVQELVTTDDTMFFYVSGADAANFEIGREPYKANPDPEFARTRWFIQWAGGVTPATGTYNVTVNGMNGNRVVTSKAHTVTVGIAPYTGPDVIAGSQLVSWIMAADATDGATTYTQKAITGYAGNATNATSGKRPVKASTSYNGTHGITFDGSDDYLEMALTGMPAGTPIGCAISWIADGTGASGGRLVAAVDDPSNDYANMIALLRNGTGTTYSAYAGTFQGSNTASNSTPHVIGSNTTSAAGQSSTTIFVDGVGGTASSAYATPSFTPDVLRIGGNTAGECLGGVTAGFAVWHGYLHPAKVAMISAYLDV